MLSSKRKDDIFIIESVRTPVGSPFKGLKDFTAAQLASFCLNEIVQKNPLIKQDIDQIILGNTVSAGTGQNLAREAIILSGISENIPGFLVNSVCGSGLQSVIVAIQAMRAGDCNLVVAGGSESATFCPQLVNLKDTDPVDSLVHDGLWCSMSNQHMGQLAEQLAQKYKISRQAQDEFSVLSHQKAVAARQQGKFKMETAGIQKKNGQIFHQDERPRQNISLEMMTKLPSVFQKEGTITAGNASCVADGAAMVLLATEKAVKKHDLCPQAKILGYSSIAVAPEECFEAAAKAVPACLSASDLTSKEIDLFEIGESFAVQAIWTKSVLDIPEEKMNIFGGDVALGHPLGSTGARMLVTLSHALKDRRKKRGLVTVCFGSGGAVALTIERL